MKKQISTHAAAAKEIRQYLKAQGIKARVKAKTYSMGNSVDVYIQEDINPAWPKRYDCTADSINMATLTG